MKFAHYHPGATNELESSRSPSCPHDLRTTRRCLQADRAANTSAIARNVLRVYRVGHLLQAGGLPRPLTKLFRPPYRVIDLLCVKLLAGADLAAGCCAGPGLVLPHGGKGVVLQNGVVLGDGVTIYHQVTIGWKELYQDGVELRAPVIGDRVYIGTGARILGGIRVGDNAQIGANAVVTSDVPRGARAVGVPARVIAVERGLPFSDELP